MPDAGANTAFASAEEAMAGLLGHPPPPRAM
jgi:hypothetical protein